MVYNRLAFRLADINTATLSNGSHTLNIRLGNSFDSHNGQSKFVLSVPLTTNQSTTGQTADISISSVNNTSQTFYKATPITLQYQFATSIIGTMGGSSAATFAVSGVPTGATAVFSPSSGTFNGSANGPSTTLNIDAPATAAGAYPLTVSVTAYGITRSCNVTLNVQSGVVTPPPPPSAPAGWSINFGGQDSYAVSTPVKLSVHDQNGYPVTTSNNIIWTLSMGAAPTPEPGGNSNWRYDYTMPSTNAAVVANAVINMPGGVSYTLPAHTFNAVALGNPQFTYGPSIVDEGGGLNWTIIWAATGAQSGDWSVGSHSGGNLDTNTVQGFTQTFNLTNEFSPCYFTLNLYGGPNKTGTALYQTWQIF